MENGSAVDGAPWPCREALVPHGGLGVAADYRFEFEFEELGYRATVYMSPGLLGEAATGLLLRDGLASPGDVAVVEAVERVGPLGFRVSAGLRRAGPGARGPPRGRVPWGSVEAAYRDLLRMVPKSRCPYALHTMAAYAVLPGGGVERLEAVSDASRHAAALKLAGLLSRRGAEEGWGDAVAVLVVSTGRLSGDAVRALSAAGASVLVANHHPLLSGLLEAEAAGVALVLRRRDGRGLAAYVNPGLVEGAPAEAPGPGARGSYRGVTPLC